MCIRDRSYNPHTTLLVAHFDDAIKAEEAVKKILPLGPSAAELVDYHTLEFIAHHSPKMLRGIDANNLPKIILLIEFDDEKQSVRSKKTTKANKILSSYTNIVKYASTTKEQNALWNIRRLSLIHIWTIVS